MTGAHRTADLLGWVPVPSQARVSWRERSRAGNLARVAEAHLSFITRCAAIAGAALGEGAFSPCPAVWVGKREVAHFDGPDVLDVRLTRGAIRDRRSEWRNDDRVELRRGTSDWIRVRTRSQRDRSCLHTGERRRRRQPSNCATGPSPTRPASTATLNAPDLNAPDLPIGARKIAPDRAICARVFRGDCA